MDIALRLHQLWALLGVSKGTLKLPFRCSGILGHGHGKTLTGIALLLLSFLIAQGAHEASLSTGRGEWERQHAPGLKIWEFALGSRGYKPVTQEYAFLKKTRFLSALDSSAKFWLSPEQACIALFEQQNETPSKLFCAIAKAKSGGSSGWEPIGTGWPGFEVALARIDQMKSQPRPAPAKL